MVFFIIFPLASVILNSNLIALMKRLLNGKNIFQIGLVVSEITVFNQTKTKTLALYSIDIRYSSYA